LSLQTQRNASCIGLPYIVQFRQLSLIQNQPDQRKPKTTSGSYKQQHVESLAIQVQSYVYTNNYAALIYYTGILTAT